MAWDSHIQRGADTQLTRDKGPPSVTLGPLDVLTGKSLIHKYFFLSGIQKRFQ